MPIVSTTTPTVAKVAAMGVAAAPETTHAPRPTSRMSAPSASRLGMASARDDVEGSDEHFARRGFLAREPAHELEWRAIQGGRETLFAADRRQRPTQRPGCCGVLPHRFPSNARANRALTRRKEIGHP